MPGLYLGACKCATGRQPSPWVLSACSLLQDSGRATPSCCALALTIGRFSNLSAQQPCMLLTVAFELTCALRHKLHDTKKPWKYVGHHKQCCIMASFASTEWEHAHFELQRDKHKRRISPLLYMLCSAKECFKRHVLLVTVPWQ